MQQCTCHHSTERYLYKKGPVCLLMRMFLTCAWHIQQGEQGLKVWALQFRHSAALGGGDGGKSAQLKCSVLSSSSRSTKCSFYSCCGLYCCSERKQRVFTHPENNVTSSFPLPLCDLVATFETSRTRSWWQTQHHTFPTVCFTDTVYTPHCAWCYKSQSTEEWPCAERNSPSLTPASWGAVCESIWQKYVEGVHV